MSANIVFIGGISGVFVGMGIIYLSIRITAILVKRLEQKKEAPK